MASKATVARFQPMKWLGVLPFFTFVFLLLILPALYIVVGAFRAPDCGFTLQNIADLNTPTIRNAYWVSIRVSFWSALLGCVIGFGMAARRQRPQPPHDRRRDHPFLFRERAA